MRCAGLSPRNGLGEDRNHGAADVIQVRTWVGLDVHAAKEVVAIADSAAGELAARKMGGGAEQLADFCAGLPAPVKVAYEAGSTGFGLAQEERPDPTVRQVTHDGSDRKGGKEGRSEKDILSEEEEKNLTPEQRLARHAGEATCGRMQTQTAGQRRAEAGRTEVNATE